MNEKNPNTTHLTEAEFKRYRKHFFLIVSVVVAIVVAITWWTLPVLLQSRTLALIVFCIYGVVFFLTIHWVMPPPMADVFLSSSGTAVAIAGGIVIFASLGGTIGALFGAEMGLKIGQTIGGAVGFIVALLVSLNEEKEKICGK